MCGIVGVVSSAPVSLDTVVAMRDRIAHRGPDNAGAWRSDDGRVCFGHQRLAIIDLDPSANQPFLTADGRFALTYNGEIYNYRALRAELEALGARFRTQSDSEVLVEGYRYWGEACVERFGGMFAFALWDAKERRLFCGRDRAGEKPFYYSLCGGAFLFASELKALVAWPGFARALDHTAVADYLALGFVPDPKTIWEGCLKLAPGSTLTVKLGADGRPEVSAPVAYWDLTFDPDEAETDWGERIRATLLDASREMTVADVPVGTFLSGGVDSSSVTAALAKAGCPLRTFTIGFDEDSHDERPFARQVARLYGTEHTERVVTPDDITAVLDKLLWHYDEPFNDYSYLPTYYVSREARKDVTVALSGDGADELFAGYSKYTRLALRTAVEGVVPGRLSSALAAGAQAMAPAGRLRNKLAHYASTPALAVTGAIQIGFERDAVLSAAGGRLAATLRDYDPMDGLLATLRRAPPEEVGLMNALRYLDFKVSLAGDMLVKVDRASMAVGLEVRPVYLHRDMLALAGRVPPRLLADRTQGKKVLKAALKPWLPDSILYRRKQGFALPLQKWLGGGLGDVFDSGKGGGALAELLPPAKRAALLKRQEASGRDPAGAAHSLFFLDRWLAKWM